MFRIWATAGAPFACMLAACPAQAAEKIDFNVPAGSLDMALVRFATQAKVSIEIGDPSLRSVRVRALQGHHTVRDGLRRLLSGTGYEFRILSGQVVKIMPRRHSRPSAQRPPPEPASPLPSPPMPPPEPIVVTATKQNTELGDYPGSVHLAEFDQAQSFRLGSKGSEMLLTTLPNLASTGLGTGRNKIFIRGIADSSFNGQTQSTISQYLGESRLIYSAPDPDLALYDVERVEVVEGPQGTLYGAGSLGGVIRISPRSPKLGKTEWAGSTAVSLTGNEIGGEAAIVGNIPVSDNSAVRIVGYGIRKPGYIDDLERGLGDINRTAISGLRATLRLEASDDLSFDLGVVGQNTASKDGQYTDGSSSGLTRKSYVAQPFDNDYRLAFFTVRADLGAFDLVSNTSYTDHAIDTVFDVTSPTERVPLVFKEDMNVSLLAHETRLSGSGGAISSWVVGVSAARNVNHASRFLGSPDDPAILSVGRSETLDLAGFGEATANIWKSLSVTAGGRLSYVRQIDEFKAPVEAIKLEPSHSSFRLLPTVAISWKPVRGIIAYYRYQEGFRPGAQQLVGAGTQTMVQRFEPDEIATSEVGIRFGTKPGARISGGISYAYTRWSNVQADLISHEGFPYVANLGSGLVKYASADLAWRPLDNLNLEASAFLNSSALDRPSPAFADALENDLPNVADSGWKISGRFEPWLGETSLSVDAAIGYVGKSQLAIGAPFDRSQGKYLYTSLGARADFGGWGLSIDAENLLDSRANRFSYGNPFSLAAGEQRTPLRPRTIRIGVDARF